MEFDPIESCPYDKVHRIRRSRMQFHITICSKNFPTSKMMQCPFDARHKVNQVEFEYHKNHCQARESVINYAIHDTTVQAEQRILPIDVKPVAESDENWDEGANVKTYNPLQAIQDKPIVYPIIGLSKAKRKNHRIQERLRFNQIMENSGHQSANQTEMQSNSLFMKPRVSAKMSVANGKDEEEYKPLRRPYNKSNSVPQDKNKKIVHSEDLKKSSPKDDKTPNISFNHSTSINGKNPILNKSKDNNSVIDKLSRNSTLNKSMDNDSIIDKLSRTFEEIVVNDEGHKKKTEHLDKELDMLKKIPTEKKKVENRSNNFQ